MPKLETVQNFKDKQQNIKDQVENGTVKETTKLPDGTYAVTFSSGDKYDLTAYNPNDRCPAARTITTRNFAQSNNSGGDYSQTVEEESVGIDISGIKNKNCKQIAKQLLDKKINDQGDQLNVSQLIGILANIQAESGYSPSKSIKIEGTENYAVGICQWTTGRATKMQRACGEQWMTNLKGQVDYMWTELTNGYKSAVLTPMLNTVTENTKEMAYKALKIFYSYTHSKVNGNSDIIIADRKKIVDSLWKQIKITGYQGSGTKYNLTEQQIKELIAGCIQENGDSKKSIQAEASLMCNLAYKNKQNVYDYVKNGALLKSGKRAHWFALTTRNAMKNNWQKVTPDQYKLGYAVFNGGLRTIPDYIDEHDSPSDIIWIKYDGKTQVNGSLSTSNKKRLIPGKSVLCNKWDSIYTFHMFFQPNNGGDPYGSKTYPVKFS